MGGGGVVRGLSKGNFPWKGRDEDHESRNEQRDAGVRTRYEQLAICDEASGSFVYLRIKDAQLKFIVDYYAWLVHFD